MGSNHSSEFFGVKFHRLHRFEDGLAEWTFAPSFGIRSWVHRRDQHHGRADAGCARGRNPCLRVLGAMSLLQRDPKDLAGYFGQLEKR
jgi:hypothetical protein